MLERLKTITKSLAAVVLVLVLALVVVLVHCPAGAPVVAPQ